MNAAGCRKMELADECTGVAFPVVVLYPATGMERPERFGPYTLQVAMDAEATGHELPLVVISHGNGGSHLVYRTIGEHLARHGFVVAMPEHARNNRNNNELGGTAENLKNRPRQLRQTIDAVCGAEWIGRRLRPDWVAVLGHSLGGYAALALAGGRPRAFAHEAAGGEARDIPVERDDRVKALVLLAPATPWFMAPGALSEVRVPILMLTAEKDPHTPEGHGAIVRNGLPATTPLRHRVVANAGHFSFLSPFPAEMRSASFPPSMDPQGFDRESFHRELNEEVREFLGQADCGRQ